MKKILIIFLMGFLALTGCVSKEPEIVLELSFQEFLDSLLVEVIDPEDLGINLIFNDPTTFNIEPGMYVLGFNTLEDYQESKEFYQSSIKMLNAYQDLEGQEALDRDVLVSIFKSYLDDDLYYYHAEGERLGYARSMIANIATYLEVYEFRTAEDVERYFNFLDTLPEYLEMYVDLEIVRQDKNMGYGQEILDKIVDMADNTASEAMKDDYFLKRLFDEKMDQADFDTQGYKEQNSILMNEKFAGGYKLLADRLSEIKAAPTTGLVHKKDGAKYYEHLLKQNTGLDMSVKEIKSLLQKKLQSQILEVFSYDEALINKLYEDDFYPDFDDGKALLDFLEVEIKADFPEIDAVNYDINTVDPSMAESASPAYYFTPFVDYDSSMKQHIFINGAYNNALYTTFAHEGFPGHMYQFNYNLKTSAHPIRNILTVSGNAEGWANYVETYAIKYISDENFMELYAMNQELTQIITVLIDIGIHYDGWTLEEMKDYLVDMGFASASATAADFSEMYVYIAAHPAVYPMYYVSSIKINMLKEEAKASWDNYSDYLFHEKLLEIGSARFDVVEQYLD